MKSALIAMSGGVDSSVAALLVSRMGMKCIGATMKLFENGDTLLKNEKSCCSLEDSEDARSVARKLGMPYYVFNFTDCFRNEVIERFINSYENGITPNPCIDCNRYLKFDKLYRRAKETGYDYVVTGHYARIEFNESTGRYELKKAEDKNKDQSYVLYTMTQDQLAHTMFPLGGLTKPEVRKIASENGFINADKHESQDICFVQGGKYTDFIRNYTGKEYAPGNFTDTEGNIIGRHRGIINYTVGQHKGLGLVTDEPMYVKKIDPSGNTVVLCCSEDLMTREFIADNVNLISVSEIRGTAELNVKIRYRHEEKKAFVEQLSDGRLKIRFEEPQRAITPGQAVVLYDGDTVAGGGVITEVM